uniref:putative late blight resistance protein homolog R1A-10 n=1 Tax=Erigeron canadensis TaxID=72917 RepID=UPI001CB93005|nr:putative late blight resistance protein homolog R1A-10 [Erigeron canadensis]
MADAVATFLKKLFSDIHELYKSSHESLLSSAELQDQEREVTKQFDALMGHLKKMMLGYDNEQVQVIFTILEQEVAQIHAQNFARLSLSDGIIQTCEELCNNQCDRILETCEELCNIRYGLNIVGEDIVVGLDDEVQTLLDQLTDSTKQLQVISITGMPGIGKSTLARKLYTDPLIEYVFHIRAWTCVSQAYVKRDVLLGILKSFLNYHTEESYKMTDEQLGEKLYRLLKGRQYLVVLDDIWDSVAWNDLRIYFPDDKTGSRVLFTSRDTDVSLNVGSARPALVLRPRTEDESWVIFQTKVFRTGICPHRLWEFGRVITRNCEGLPLAIELTAGLLKNKTSDNWWEKIAQDTRSYMVRDRSQYIDSLALSYNHLSRELQRCFLFLGLFPEDYDIPVTKLIWLWVAQGFIRETGSKILEDVAEDFLMELIKRGLLKSSKKRAEGLIKACRIHDLLRELCLKKGEEEINDTITKGHEPDAESSYPDITIYVQPGLSFNWAAFSPNSSLCHPFKRNPQLSLDGHVSSINYHFLRILDAESVHIPELPTVHGLVNLRYLAIQTHDGSPQASISRLVNLQTLIILSEKSIVLPATIWNMVNVRHLYMKSKAGENFIQEPYFVQVTDKKDCHSGLASLQTLSHICPRSCQNLSLRNPNLRKLGFCGPLISTQGDIHFPNIRSLEHLHKLKLSNTLYNSQPTRLLNASMFPDKLRNLTLSNTGMDWEDMQSLSLLPNLEVLKLKFHACIGEIWETSNGGFQRLRILKLHVLNLGEWICSRDDFPRLQRLVVLHCSNLKSIPSDLGRIYTLEEIDVQGCRKSAQVSALDIQEEQENEGNCLLKVLAADNYS